MRKLMIFTILMILSLTLAQTARANDIDVSNVSLQNVQGTGSSMTVDVKFDLFWKNSFATNPATASPVRTDGNTGTVSGNYGFYDRAWVFVKYIKSTNVGSDTAWKHATLVAGGTVGAYAVNSNSSSAYYHTGYGLVGNNTSNASPYKGAFCIPGYNQTLRWAIGTDESPATTDIYIVRVFAIEMVYVPTGPFYIGDGKTGQYNLSLYDTSTSSYVTTAIGTTAVSGVKSVYSSTQQGPRDDTLLNGGSGGSTVGITIGGSSGTLAGNGISDIAAGGTINNPNFPTGYNGFYIMKYEISQGQYVDFLNTLTRAQQANSSGSGRTGRTALTLASTATNSSLIYAMYNLSTLTARNTISCSTVTANLPIVFSTTTPCRACNYLNWVDVFAYADWAGLRPMTELEYEKACRGTDTPVTGEYAWHTASYTAVTSLSYDGTPKEVAGQTGSGLFSSPNVAALSPTRCGFAATASTTRVTSGASYYGVMDLSGNVSEVCITVGHPRGRSFTGVHGDGSLDPSTGNANISDWPGYYSDTSGNGDTWTAYYNGTNGGKDSGYVTYGAGERGLSVNDGAGYAAVSNREWSCWSYGWTSGYQYRGEVNHLYGGRCVRTAPQ